MFSVSRQSFSVMRAFLAAGEFTAFCLDSFYVLHEEIRRGYIMFITAGEKLFQPKIKSDAFTCASNSVVFHGMIKFEAKRFHSKII